MRRWKVTAMLDRPGMGALSWISFIDAETRDEAQHRGREIAVATDARFKGATLIVEPAKGRGWT